MSVEQEIIVSPEERGKRLFQAVSERAFGEESQFESLQGQQGIETVYFAHGENSLVTLVHHRQFLGKGETIGIQHETFDKHPKTQDPIVTRRLHGAMNAEGNVVTQLTGADKQKKERETKFLFAFAAQGMQDETLTPLTLAPGSNQS